LAERDAEAALRCARDFGRHEVGEQLAQQELRGAVAHLPAPGQSTREAQHSIIEQWHARFDAVAHGDAIGLLQHAARERPPHVGEEYGITFGPRGRIRLEQRH